MDIYWTFQEHNLYVPYLIDEIFYFNIFVQPCLFNRNAKIVGIKKCQYFIFLLIDDRAVMQYKVSL
jgi:hypothetical protein